MTDNDLRALLILASIPGCKMTGAANMGERLYPDGKVRATSRQGLALAALRTMRRLRDAGLVLIEHPSRGPKNVFILSGAGETLVARLPGNVGEFTAGATVVISCGNPNRGPETGPGHGREVLGKFLRVECGQPYCALLVDDPDAVGKPDKVGDKGLWCWSQVRLQGASCE